MIEIATDLAFLSTGFLARDWALLPVKVGDDEDCEDLQARVDSVKKRMGVDIPITITEHPGMPWAAHGGTWYGAAGITVPTRELYEMEKRPGILQNAFITHEIGHITNNDGAKLHIIVCITFVALKVIFSAMLPVGWLVTKELLATAGFFTAALVRSRFQERAADITACRFMTRGEKLALSGEFERIRESNIESRNSLIGPDQSIFSKIRGRFITPSGESIFGLLTHPSLTSRAEYFKEEAMRDATEGSYATKLLSFFRLF